MKNIDKHPCFNAAAKHKYGRVHLPVAPKCNIQCKYCNRKYDCVNESRPGVTSAVLSPRQALGYFRAVKEAHPEITVAGIAGPGDPMANAEKTIETIKLIRAEFPETLFCLSTNGLMLPPHIDELVENGVTHFTLTINTVEPEIGAKIYSWVRDNKRIYRGVQGADLLMERQFASIVKLKEKGVLVKVNTIVVPGINEDHIKEVAWTMSRMGVDVMNCMPLCPAEGAEFAHFPEPDAILMSKVRGEASQYLKLMTHCQRCRADAVGLLGKDIAERDELLKKFEDSTPKPSQERPYVAVATQEGLFVNRHLGESDHLVIFQETSNGYATMEKRIAPATGSGDDRWKKLADMLSDCSAIMVGGVGERPLEVLKDEGLNVVEMSGLIEEGLDHIYKGRPLKCLNKRELFKCGTNCSGSGVGCGA